MQGNGVPNYWKDNMARNRSAYQDVPEILRNFLHEHRPVEVDELRVLVAVSGGPDSMALLAATTELTRNGELRVYAAHLIHHPDSAEANQRASLVQEYCRKRDIPLVIEKLTESGDAGLSPEERMREARYRFLEKSVRAKKCHVILTGHHKNDQAETILYRLLTGTGLRGLSGIPDVRENILRPFLRLQKEDLQDYCERFQVPFAEDPANYDMETPRNYIRHKLLPLIERDVNPNVSEALVRLGERASEAEEIIAFVAQECWEKSLLNFQKDKIVLDIRSILVYFTAIRKYTVQRAISELAGTELNLNSRDLDRIDEFILNSRTGSYLEFPQGIKVVRDRQSLIISLGSKPELNRTLIPGRDVEIPEIGAAARWSRPEAGERFSGDGLVADMDIGGEDCELILRYAQEKDQFHPLGSKGTKRLLRFLTDRKVPRFEKRTTPVLVQDGTIIWVVGHRISENVRIKDPAKGTWRLQLVPTGSDDSP